MSSENTSVAGVAAGAIAGAGLGFFLSPLRSKLFLLALLATGAAAYFVVSAGMKDPAAAPPDWAPTTLRVGASFLAAFVFAYLVRRAIVLALLVGGVLVAGAVVLHKLGLGVSQQQVDTINQTVHDAAEQVQKTADSTWTHIKPYLPSGGAAGFGLFRGARHAPPKPTTDA